MKQSIALLILSIVLSPISSLADSECYYTRQCYMKDPGTNCKPDDTLQCDEKQGTLFPYRCQVTKDECKNSGAACDTNNTKCDDGDKPM